MKPISNDHNVYIVGAGFSSSRGLPLISNFMFEMRDAWQWLTAQGRHTEAKAAEDVLKFRLASTPASYRVRVDLENIEELFSLASASGADFSASIQLAIAATLDYCKNKNAAPSSSFGYEARGAFWPPGWRLQEANQVVLGSLPLYSAPFYEFVLYALMGGFSAGPQLKRNTFITFNYDTLIEEALGAIGKPMSYGFRPRSSITDSSASWLGLGGSAGVEILKLHGSVNWGYPGRRGGKLTVFGSYEDLQRSGITPHLIPPTWNKSFESLSDVWLGALRAIGDATRLVVIGFSMPPTDLHFKYLVAAGLRDNISLREIVFVTVDESVLRPRVSELFGDPDKRPVVRIVNRSLSTCLNPNIDDFLSAIGRPARVMNVMHDLTSRPGPFGVEIPNGSADVDVIATPGE